jgi:hypothetical protein
MAEVYLAACMTYANHAPYLREWIEFHTLVGVERFFLYDNGATDGSAEVLAPYVAAGRVEVQPWPGRGRQADAFSDCVARHRDDARWIAFIDVDEFLFNARGRPVSDVLAGYEEYPGVGVNLLNFGTSGHRTPPPGLVTENYLHRTDTGAIKWVKSIVNPQAAVRAIGPHTFEYTDGQSVDVAKEPLEGPQSRAFRIWGLRINHYHAKSEQEIVEKWSLPRADTGAYRGALDLEELRRIEERFVRDETILMYLPPLRQALGIAD